MAESGDGTYGDFEIKAKYKSRVQVRDKGIAAIFHDLENRLSVIGLSGSLTCDLV